MNLFIRCLRIILLARLGAKRPFSEEFTSRFIVGLHDLGWRDHLPNYRFLSFMELGAFHFFHGARLALSGKYNSRMIAAQEVIYLQPIRPFQKVEMKTRLIGWDEKYLYFQHDFYVKGKLKAVGLVKEICMKAGKKVSPQELLGELEKKTPVIESWLKNHQQIRDSF